MRTDAEVRANFVCIDCKGDTHQTDKDYYMVEHHIWAKHGAGDKMLCIGCLEKRVGRLLEGEDFLECPLNKHLNSYVSALKYGPGIEHFKAWVDSYKKLHNWHLLFNSDLPFTDNTYSEAPKYHELPVAMQIGIFQEYMHDAYTELLPDVGSWRYTLNSRLRVYPTMKEEMAIFLLRINNALNGAGN